MAVGMWVRRILGLALALGICAGLWWLRPMPAAPAALAVVEGSDPAVQVEQSRSLLTLRPAGAEAPTRGLVFYPGARVDPRAYASILAPIAAGGYVVAIVKAPYDLPITEVSAAAGVIDAEPDITWWAVGGHSLGGVAASSFAAADPRVDAVVLWASYPVVSLAQDTVAVLSVSGGNDGLTTPADIEASRANLPPGTEYVAVPGAVHAFFGDYGEQSGDGDPDVSREAAQAEIVATTLTWLNTVSASP